RPKRPKSYGDLSNMYDPEIRQSFGFYRGKIPAVVLRADPVLMPHDPPPPNTDATFAHPDPMLNKDVFRQQGYTGSQCSNCNSLRMKVSGHCEVCEECGTT